MSKVNNEDSIFNDSLKYSKLIILTIELPELQKYYKVQETIGQEVLVILENRFSKDLENIMKFKKPIRVMTETEIRENRIKAFLEYKDVVVQNDTARIYYRYDVQGIGIKSVYNYSNERWILINADLWEN